MWENKKRIRQLEEQIDMLMSATNEREIALEDKIQTLEGLFDVHTEAVVIPRKDVYRFGFGQLPTPEHAELRKTYTLKESVLPEEEELPWDNDDDEDTDYSWQAGYDEGYNDGFDDGKKSKSRKKSK